MHLARAHGSNVGPGPPESISGRNVLSCVKPGASPVHPPSAQIQLVRFATRWRGGRGTSQERASDGSDSLSAR
jgi:hypothetical protein